MILNLVCMKGTVGEPRTNMAALGVIPPVQALGPRSVGGSPGDLSHARESTDRQDSIRSGSAGWACSVGLQKQGTSVFKRLISCLHHSK